MEPFEKTYAMIKPDALRAGKAEEICQLIEVHGFTIIAKQKLQVCHCTGPVSNENKDAVVKRDLAAFTESVPKADQPGTV